MKIVRLYTGNDQKSHFEEIELNSAATNRYRPPTRGRRHGRFSLAHRRAPSSTAIRRRAGQYLVTLSGSWEIEASNGVKRVFKTGDVMLADDTTGEGHTSRVLGSDPHVFMTVPLAD